MVRYPPPEKGHFFFYDFKLISLSHTTVIILTIPESHVLILLCDKLEGFLVLDGYGTINHMRTTGPVVFLHCSGPTNPSLRRNEFIAPAQ